MKILVRNYNPEKKEYDKFYSILKDLSFEQIKDLLKEVPIDSENSENPASIISDDYIITRYNTNTISFKYNHGFRYNYFVETYLGARFSFIFPEIPKLFISIEKTDELFKRKSTILILKIWHRLLISLILTVFYSIIPFYNIIIIAFNITHFTNIITVGFLYILLTLSFISIISIFAFSFQYFKVENYVEIESFIPYEAEIQTFGISLILLLYGQAFYIFFLSYYSFKYVGFSNCTFFNIYYIIVLILAISTLIGFPVFLLLLYYILNNLKDEVLQTILKIMNQEKNYEKIYYQNLYFHLKEKKLLTYRWITIIITAFSFFFTIIPLFLLP